MAARALKMKSGPLIETARGVAFPWLCDSMGHLATQHYMALFDVASFHFLASAGPGLAKLATRHRGWADVRHEVDYRREVRTGELLYVRSQLLRRGRTSLQYRHIMSGEDDTVRAEMRATTVHFDLKRRVAIPLPASRRGVTS